MVYLAAPRLTVVVDLDPSDTVTTFTAKLNAQFQAPNWGIDAILPSNADLPQRPAGSNVVIGYSGPNGTSTTNLLRPGDVFVTFYIDRVYSTTNRDVVIVDITHGMTDAIIPLDSVLTSADFS